MAYDASTSILAGLSNEVLQARLEALQLALLDLSAGKSVVTVNYASGDGSKGVTYRQTDIATITQMIRLIQAQLGTICSPRQAIGVTFYG